MTRAVKSGIYAITNGVNSKVYVGSAVNIAGRWRAHMSQLRRGTHHSGHLQAAWIKYGEAAFSFSVLEYVTDQSCLLREEDKWIAIFRAADHDKGYNICPKAGSQLGTKRSRESKEKMSASAKGRVKSEAHQEAINRALRGRRLGEECKAKLSASQTGRKHTDEARQKMREARSDMKNTMSPESFERMAKANLGRKFSDEHRARISAALGSRVMKDETRLKISEARKKAEAAKREAKMEVQPPLLGFRLRDELARTVLTDADAAADLAGTTRPT